MAWRGRKIGVNKGKGSPQNWRKRQPGMSFFFEAVVLGIAILEAELCTSKSVG